MFGNRSGSVSVNSNISPKCNVRSLVSPLRVYNIHLYNCFTAQADQLFNVAVGPASTPCSSSNHWRVATQNYYYAPLNSFLTVQFSKSRLTIGQLSSVGLSNQIGNHLKDRSRIDFVADTVLFYCDSLSWETEEHCFNVSP